MKTLYKIIDPRNQNVVYIGMTSIPLNKRLLKHETKSRRLVQKSRFNLWLNKLLSEGLKPLIVEIMKVSDESASETEAILISGFKLVGHPLLNTYKMY